MKPSHARQQYIDDELLRLPMVADQVLQSSLAAVQDALPRLGPHDRAVAANLLQQAPSQRQRLVDAFVTSVRSQVQEEAAQAAKAPHEDFTPSGLSLLDEAEIAADVEMSRAIEAIKSVAEHELRELATFTSALAGDMDVSRDHNPFRAETYARALWSAAQTLAPDAQVSLMRHGGMPLAQVLRKVYAASCARLESVGVEPAVYRTLILPSGSRTARPSESWQGRAPDMNQVREALPASAPRSESPAATGESSARRAGGKAEAQVFELMGRLFEAMLSDRRISRDIRSVLARLQPSVLRLVMSEPAALEDYGHPVWRFMDQTAHLAALQPSGSEGREQVLRLAERVVESAAQVAKPDGELFRQGMGRLAADDRERLATRLHAAADTVASLQDIEDRLAEETQASLPTGVGPLDTSQLETVPADLLDELPATGADPEAEQWLARRRPGDWVRLFIQGQWVRAQLLWQGRHGDAWLFGIGQSGQTVALRRRALERLQTERLLLPLRVRSMLRSAAVLLMRSAGKTPG